MTTFTGTSKSSNTTLNSRYKAGSGWRYDDPNLEYDSVKDPVTNYPITYDGVGTLPVFSGVSKSSAVTLTPRSKS